MKIFGALILSIVAERTASFSNLPPITKSTVVCGSAVDSKMVKVGSGEAMVDAAALLEGQAFPIKPEALIDMAKSYLTSDFIAQGESMSDAGDFQFLGPVVGPLSKEAYLKAIASFDVYSIFPDINPRYYGFTADPFDAGRVWAISRGIGSNPESGKSFEAPPQAVSVTFNEAGKVVKFTIGHVMDVSVGNTGGLGGLFGPLYAVGKGLPFREAQPYKPSLRYRAFNFIGSLASKFSEKKSG
jgi:hypothetical protein